MTTTVAQGLRLALLGVIANAVLALVKVATGVAGHSYALVADGIESLSDTLSSTIVWAGLRIGELPPDEGHPYGHGKAETLAAMAVSAGMLGAAVLIGYQSVIEILTPHLAPAWYTLPVLAGVIALKVALSHWVARVGGELGSTALKCDAWHHYSDALTSAAAFIGIGIALIGGPGWELADDVAALFACAVIAYNAAVLMNGARNEIMDASVAPETLARIRSLAAEVDGVAAIEKCRIRKSGIGLLMDIHVEVDGDLSVRRGHDIAHSVKARLIGAGMQIRDVVVHIEPAGGTPPPDGPTPGAA